MASRLVLLFAVALGSSLGLPSTDSAAPRCSFRIGFLPRAPGMVAFLGSALADTADAGPGSVRFDTTEPAGAFRGQVVSVERLEARASRDLDAAVRQAGGRVVLVPWDYGADCRTLSHSGRADWIPAGTRGLFQGKLRSRAEWAGGIPTLDVSGPEFVPYPSAPEVIREQRGSSLPWATAEQILEVISTIPVSPRDRLDHDRFARAIEEWARRHPELAVLEPVASDIESVQYSYRLTHASFHRIKSPVAGTWQFEVTLGGRDTLRFFGRTAETPITGTYDTTRLAEPPEYSDRRPPIAYGLYSMFSRSADSLEAWSRAPGSRGAAGYLEVVTEPVFRTRDSTVWRGALPVDPIRLIRGTLPDELARDFFRASYSGDTLAMRGLEQRGLDPTWRRLYAADSIVMQQRFHGGARYPARFILKRDGGLTAEQEVRVDGRLIARIRAERIGPTRYPGERIPPERP